MKTVLFATGNKRKISEARLGCEMFGIKVKQIKLEIDEIQSHNPKDISKHKVKLAYFLAKKPIVVSDTFWNIPSLGGFPGGYMKDISGWFTSNDFIKLVENKTDKRISFTESIVYKDSAQMKTFSKEYWGILVEKPKGIGNSIENVTEFDGVTLGERREEGGFSHKPEEYIWAEFAKWYAKE